MPRFDALAPDILGRWAKSELDPAGQLEKYL
jgi:hypothetical protein